MTPRPTFLPYGRQAIDDDDVAAVVSALRDPYLTTGPRVEAFESAFAAKVGARYAVACSSGTAALHLTVLALGVTSGARTIVPAITFAATANAARFVGADVRFTDVDPDSGLMTEAGLTAVSTHHDAKRLEALYPVHLNGQVADMEAVARVARRHGLAVVEDACHALGGTYQTIAGETVTVGSCRHSDMTVFSFHPVKVITSAEGGMVTTNDGTLYERLLSLRNHGITRDPARMVDQAQAYDSEGLPNPWYYEIHDLGFNYRLTDLQCALGLSQLSKLDRFLTQRRALAKLYDDLLASAAPRIRPAARRPGVSSGWHLYVVLIDFADAGVERSACMRALRAEGVVTQVHYLPVPWHPYYRKLYDERPLPGASAYYARALSLPLFAKMTESDVHFVVTRLRAALRS